MPWIKRPKILKKAMRRAKTSFLDHPLLKTAYIAHGFGAPFPMGVETVCLIQAPCALIYTKFDEQGNLHDLLISSP